MTPGLWLAILRPVLVAVCVVQAALETLYYVHMLQLNSYRPERYTAWMRENDDRSLPRTRLIAAAPLAVMMVFGCGENTAGVILYAVTVLLCGISAVLDIPKKAKKPLVFTARVKRLLVTQGIITVLFAAVALLVRPDRITAASLLLLVVLCPLTVGFSNRINMPLERRIARGYTEDAKRLLAQNPRLTVIGITGSYGKTSVKNFLYALLSVRYNVLMTPESYNTPMGVVRTIREQLQPAHDIFLCEMGAKNPGDIREICEIVHPKYGVITAIGEQHLETFGEIGNIIRTKFELADALPSDGAVFLNTDNPYIASRPVENTRIVTYGTVRADYTAGGTVSDETGTRFTVTAPNGEQCEFTTRLLGLHNVQNLTGCIAVANTLGISLSALKTAVHMVKPVPHRLQLLPGGVIDDAYNSNPAGFRCALDLLSGMKGRRVLVTPGMVELGERQEALNEELGAYAASRCDYAVLIGEKQAPPLKRGLLNAGFDRERIFVASDLHQGLSYVRQLPPEESQTVLLENDLPDNF